MGGLREGGVGGRCLSLSFFFRGKGLMRGCSRRGGRGGARSRPPGRRASPRAGSWGGTPSRSGSRGLRRGEGIVSTDARGSEFEFLGGGRLSLGVLALGVSPGPRSTPARTFIPGQAAQPAVLWPRNGRMRGALVVRKVSAYVRRVQSSRQRSRRLVARGENLMHVG